MHHRAFITTIVTLLSVGVAEASEDVPKGSDAATVRTGVTGVRPITLKDALDRSLGHHPRLAAAGYQLDADEALLGGRDGYPNPELSVEAEDFAGSGAAKGVDALQVTTAIRQEVQLGGKPGARRDVRAAQREASSIEYALEKQAVITEVALAFLDVLAHQRKLLNAGEMVKLAEATVKTFEVKVEAGRATPMEVDKASVVLSMASLEEERAHRVLLSARQRLAAACGEQQIFFGQASGHLERIRALPSLDELMARLAKTPAVLARAAEVRYRQTLLAEEKANRVPDLSFSLGYRWLNDTRDSAIIAGISVPLPLADRNKGHIGAAAFEEQRAARLSDDERVTLASTLAEAYHRLAAEHKRATVLNEEIYPKVAATYEAVGEGYRIGRFGYLDLLDAQRTLFEIKEAALEALVAYHRAAIELSGIAALPIGDDWFEQHPGEGGEPR